MSELDGRIRQIDGVVHQASVGLSELAPELIELCDKLCLHFGLKRGTLIRRAAAIAKFDGSVEGITREHFQEAAQQSPPLLDWNTKQAKPS